MITTEQRAVIALLSFFADACSHEWYEATQRPSQRDVASLHALALGALDATGEWPWGECYLFCCGAYGALRVLARGNGMDDALDYAARLVPPGMFTEPDYAGAARSLGLPGPDDCTDEQLDKVRALAERDLIETELGWLPSWEISACEYACE